MLLTLLFFTSFGAVYGYFRGYDPFTWAIYGAIAGLILLWVQYFNKEDINTSMGGIFPALVVLGVPLRYPPRQCAESRAF